MKTVILALAAIYGLVAAAPKSTSSSSVSWASATSSSSVKPTPSTYSPSKIKTKSSKTTKTHNKSTLTYTAYHTDTVSTTITGNSYVAVPVTYYRPGGFLFYSYVYTGTTTTSTYTYETSTTKFIPAPSTTSVTTTPAGFTPIKSESYYTDKIVILTGTRTATDTFTYDPSPTTVSTYVLLYSLTSTTTITTASTPYAETTHTQTYTATSAVRTRYAACHSDNLVSKIPTGQLINEYGQAADTDYSVTSTGNAEDCCSVCQSDDLCFGGFWMLVPERGLCFTLTRNPNNPNETCASNDLGYFANNPEANAQGYQFTAFNGPCGSLYWYFYDGTYVS